MQNFKNIIWDWLGTTHEFGVMFYKSRIKADGDKNEY